MISFISVTEKVMFMPSIRMVDSEWRIRWEHRNHFFSSRITLSFIELSFISPYKFSLLPAIRTERRWGYLTFPWNIHPVTALQWYPSRGEYGRYFRIEFNICISNRKTYATLFTIFCFDEMFSCWYEKHGIIVKKSLRTQKKTLSYPNWVFFGFV